jgi:hypothetical protein
MEKSPTQMSEYERHFFLRWTSRYRKTWCSWSHLQYCQSSQNDYVLCLESWFVCVHKNSWSSDLFLSQFPFTHLLTYLLTPWSRVLLEKLTGSQLVKKFPAFYGTRKFLTALTSARQLSLPWASPIQSSHPHPTFWRSILTLSPHLRLGLPSGLFPSGFPTRTL